ncbi:glutamate-1-semialdehyde 2,1-aminomutase [Comamonas aquatica]|jgi:glutamate-1-semialdehyde 2,1-aminomutase|uniref:Glutamate-1-semialdehyde 2,1-aminomutase n=1 Tax=Comamonas aquatica TaxID=225991 RepID=A0AA42L0A9_9BURK|nr:glutamate-1-semialdehyde 2,1-aminomutase [Comamonas aquatica]MDH0364157.1 glutamate-1-semialdehyde 2,1-aminomutase [Comamonas aquatica]MDH0372581.1 glutamate-1-semialdehyde 2,1-aminomutase [Comamonas aquatica]QTX19959.1 glutamate-1-semialdehyde 2,1-aminomutase [Comamonas aquatica]CAB5663897.1 Glutamate-1-semialdehyde 2,1-aminomutase [Comamonas aquatica]CAB5693301.1 Glutamate-1-semialdehyde 2,1-aminomutase [Comamonas aquatica]
MTPNTDLNLPLFERAKTIIPGGVNSPVRAFNAVGGTPRFVQRAQGAYFWDTNDQQFVDYIGSWGPMILGHGHPEVVATVQAAVLEGFSFGAPTEREVVLAEKIRELVPSMEMLRMVSSGTEAGMSALRLARGYTGRNKIIKFNGCYHGHADSLLVKAGSGLATFGASSSAGVPADVVKDTIVLEYNDVAQLEEAFAKIGNEVACVILEPIAGNMNFVRASVEFTRRIRELTQEHGALMIYDEVMTGFRVALGCAQSLYAQHIEGFVPDLTVLGKVIGGGMPMAAFGGRREIMQKLSPLGPVYQAGTLSGNPIATACGLKTLELISQPGFHAELHLKTGHLMQGLKAEADAAGIPFSIDWQGGLFGFYLLPELPSTYHAVMKTDGALFNKFYHGMLARGHYFAPALYEAGFVSSAHTEADIERTVEAARAVFQTL